MTSDSQGARSTRRRRVERVLVTGGAGFIGSHVADRFVAEGCEVTVLDDMASPVRASSA